MKKITAIALLSIAIVSCQKETKTVTKVDPKTGKTQSLNVSVACGAILYEAVRQKMLGEL